MNIKRNWPLTTAALALLGAVAGVSAGCGENGETTARNAEQLEEQAATAAGNAQSEVEKQGEAVFSEPEDGAQADAAGAADTKAAKQTSRDGAEADSQAKVEDPAQSKEQTEKDEAMRVAANEKNGASSQTEGQTKAKTEGDQAAGAEKSDETTAQAGAGGASGKPYEVECAGGDKCKAGETVMIGYQRYHATCYVCHGPTATGSTIGPSLVAGLKNMEKGEFVKIVATGSKTYQSWNQSWSVMPAWGTNAGVMGDIDGLWAFLKARSDGALPAGRPAPMEGVDMEKIEEEAAKMKKEEKPSGH